MGTDIHLFIEYCIGGGDRQARFSLTAGEFQLARDYELFGALAHVRGGEPLIPERGIPDDASEDVCRCYYQLVGETDFHDGLWQHVTRAAADEHVAKGVSTRRPWKNSLVVISDPDANHPSWLERAEFVAAVESVPGLRETRVELKAMLAALEALPADTLPRVVFWFDD